MTTLSIVELPYKKDSSYYFNQISHLPFACFIDSGNSNNSASSRYDIISASPTVTVEQSNHQTQLIDYEHQANSTTYSEDGLEIIRRKLQALTIENTTDLPFIGGFIGLLSYSYGLKSHSIEKSSHYNKEDNGGLLTPDLFAGLYHWAIISDHTEKKSVLMCNEFCSEATKQQVLKACSDDSKKLHTEQRDPFSLSERFTPNLTKNEYKRCFTKIKRYLLNGDCYQVNLAQRFESTYQGDPWDAYQNLRKKNPCPYSAFLNFGQFQILSISPEQFLGLKDRIVTTKPIKGTAPRSKDPILDNQFKDQLLNSTKNKAENLMIVDLLRNDLGRSCEIGSINVIKLFGAETYTNVHHLVSTITGKLTPNETAVDLIRKAFPGGSITGAPKKRAMEIIEELEPNGRGPYCGSVFYFSLDGNADSNIAIRTLACKDNKIYCWGGGGIVADSLCDEEYEESVTKVTHLMSALERTM